MSATGDEQFDHLTMVGTQPEELWPGGDMICLLSVTAGTCEVQIEGTTANLPDWVPLGPPMTAAGCYHFLLPPSLKWRARVVSADNLNADLEVFSL